MELSEIREQSAKAAEQVCEAAKLKIGDLFVVGCSSSEILGEKIGTHSSVEVAEAVFTAYCMSTAWNWRHSAASTSTVR